MSIEDQVMKSLDKIEAKHSAISTQQAELADRLLQLEQRGAISHSDDGNTKGTSMGAEFARQLGEHRETFERTRTISLQVDTKAMVTAATVGARQSMGATPGGDLGLAHLASVLPGKRMQGIQALTYARRGGRTEGFLAKPQNGEGAAKQEITPTYTSVTQNQITIAGYANVTEQALRSDAELASAIDLFLTSDVMDGASRVLTSGSTATGATFEGFQALATALNLPGGVSRPIEAVIAYAALHMRAGGYMPTVAVVNSSDWGEAVIRQGSDLQWMNGSPFTLPQMTVAGLRIAFSADIPDGKALLIDERYAGWGVSDTMRVDAAYVNDGFIKNIITLRGEMGLIPFMRDIWSVRLAQPIA